MEKEKDLKLVNIYIRIHNKQAITIDDLAYLAKYNPTCFKKTCDNLIYKVPEAEALVKNPESASVPPVVAEPASASADGRDRKNAPGSFFDRTAEEDIQNKRMIRHMFENLRAMEEGEAETLQQIDIEEVKELLGGLFMESLFPHSGLPEYFDICKEENGRLFNARA